MFCRCGETPHSILKIARKDIVKMDIKRREFLRLAALLLLCGPTAKMPALKEREARVGPYPNIKKISLEDAYQSYAVGLGNSVEQLDARDKQAALLTEIIS